MVNLESLDIDARGQAVPDIFGDFRRLRSLRLRCLAVENNLVESLRGLSSLTKLGLDCNTIERLPVDFGCFFTLKTLSIDCSSLQAFPKIIWQFPHLQSLCLWHLGLKEWETGKLPEFEALGHLRSLRQLELRESGLLSLPESLGRLSGLTSLQVYACDLKTLPETIGNLISLTTLDLQYSALHSLPATISNLWQLRSLHIGGCKNPKLPKVLANLPNLVIKSKTWDDEIDSDKSKTWDDEIDSDKGDSSDEDVDEGDSSDELDV